MAIKTGKISKGKKSASWRSDRQNARVGRISSAKDAGFSGQDAFGLGEDEILLDQAGEGNGDDLSGQLIDDQEEVLELDIPSTARTSSYRTRTSPEAVEDVPKPKRLRASDNQRKDLLPLESKAKTSRFERAETPQSSSETSDGDSEEDDSRLDEDWAAAGGYHVSKREIAQAEERAARESQKKFGQATDDQREALELQEAFRIQKEGKERLLETDFFDTFDDPAESPSKSSLDHARIQPNEQPPVPIFENAQDAIEHLVSYQPELLVLLDDFTRNAVRLEAVRQKSLPLGHRLAQPTVGPQDGFVMLYQELLRAYLATLAFYLHIRSHRAYPKVGAEHATATLLQLVKLRQSLASLDDLGVLNLPDEQDFDVEDVNADHGSLASMTRQQLLSHISNLDDDELEALYEEQSAKSGTKALASSSTSARQSGSSASRNRHGGSANTRRRRKTGGRSNRVEEAAPLLDLANLPPIRDESMTRHIGGETLDDYAEPTTLSASEASEKAGRNKSLRFYTSKIGAKSAKRADAARQAGGGDDDLPYRSKERARAAVLQRQQHAKNVAEQNTDLDSSGYAQEDLALAALVNESTPETVADGGYYDLVSKAKQNARASKKREYEEVAAEERAAHSLEGIPDGDNPRAINRLIMANKGLTPRRPKSVRNPRVKKRQRYEQAQKKVSSMKPVYKGGLGNAAYAGEKTGISSRTVKSRKL